MVNIVTTALQRALVSQSRKALLNRPALFTAQGVQSGRQAEGLCPISQRLFAKFPRFLPSNFIPYVSCCTLPMLSPNTYPNPARCCFSICVERTGAGKDEGSNVPALGYVGLYGWVLRGDYAAPAARVKMWAKEKTFPTESGIVSCVSPNCPCTVAGLRNHRARGSSSCCGLFRTCFQPSGVATTIRSLLSGSTFLSSLKSRHSVYKNCPVYLFTRLQVMQFWTQYFPTTPLLQ